MAEPRRPRRPIQDSRFSRPVFEETITIHSSHAQRILDRGYYRVAAALYAIDVVLRIIGDHDEMDHVEGTIDALIQAFAQKMDEENHRLSVLRQQNNITRSVKYTRPMTLTIQISSPQLAQYTILVSVLDQLMATIDTLWMNGVLTSKQKAIAGYQWRVALLRIGREIMTLERRARDAAARYGKAEEVAAATAETDVVVEHDADPTPSPQSLS